MRNLASSSDSRRFSSSVRDHKELYHILSLTSIEFIAEGGSFEREET